MNTSAAKLLVPCLLAFYLTLGPGMHMLAMAVVSHQMTLACERAEDQSAAQDPDVHCTGNCICTQMPVDVALPQGAPASVPPSVIVGDLTLFIGQSTTPDPFPPELL